MSQSMLVALSVATGAGAQGTAGHEAAGDRLYAARDSRGALQEYELTIAANPQNYDAPCKASRGAEGHVALARATGRAALAVGVRQHVDFGKIVRKEAPAALAIGPNHAGALHVMGLWNAEVMRLPGVSRFVARRFLGGQVLSEASWEPAGRYLDRAVAVEPERSVHRLDLGMILRDRGKLDGAHAQFDWIARATTTDFNDPQNKQLAATERRKL